MPKKNVLDSKRFDIRYVAKTFKTIPIELLRPGIYQSRRSFKTRALKELAASMESTGVNFNPLIIRPLKYVEGYEIICGERRWRAAQMLNMPVLLCCIGDFTDDQAMYLCGADNIQRDDLNPLEEAQAYALMLQSGMTHKDVGCEIGKSRTHVTNYLRLLSLPLAVRDLLDHEKLSFAQARPICGLTAPGLQIKIARDAVARGWTAKRIESEVSVLQTKRKSIPVRTDATGDVDIRRLKDAVSEQTGYPCAIVKTASGGWQIGLSATSVDEFQGILERLGVKTDCL